MFVSATCINTPDATNALSIEYRPRLYHIKGLSKEYYHFAKLSELTPFWEVSIIVVPYHATCGGPPVHAWQEKYDIYDTENAWTFHSPFVRIWFLYVSSKNGRYMPCLDRYRFSSCLAILRPLGSSAGLPPAKSFPRCLYIFWYINLKSGMYIE